MLLQSPSFFRARNLLAALGPISLAGGNPPVPRRAGQAEGPGKWRWALRSGPWGRPWGSVEGDLAGGSDEGAPSRAREGL